jgi:CheY-like chemotaxis protein
MNGRICVLQVDDHAMLRKGMALLLGGEADIEAIGEADDGEQAVAQARALQPDAVVMDINMPGVNGIEATRQIVSEFPDIKIIALSIHSGKHAKAASNHTESILTGTLRRLAKIKIQLLLVYVSVEKPLSKTRCSHPPRSVLKAAEVAAAGTTGA